MNKHLAYIFISLFILIFASGCTQQQSLAQQNEQSTWATYVDSSDGIKISHPANWDVIVSKSPAGTNSSTSNIVDIYTPDGDGVIQILGFSIPTLVYTTNNIPDSVYDEMVNDFHNGPEGVNPTSVIRDENSYTFNGNPARHLQIELTVENSPMTSDVYIIRHDDIYYTLSYLTIEPSAQKYSSTAVEIIKTFKTVSF